MTQNASPFPRGLMTASLWSSAYLLHSAFPPRHQFRQLSKQVKRSIGESAKSRSPLNTPLLCSILCRVLKVLSPPDTSRTGHHFPFGSASSFLLELFLCSSPGAYWASTSLGNSSFSVISFCLFILFTGFSRQEWWSGLPFPSPVGHIFSELSTVSCLSWVALHNRVHSFTE